MYAFVVICANIPAQVQLENVIVICLLPGSFVLRIAGAIPVGFKGVPSRALKKPPPVQPGFKAGKDWGAVFLGLRRISQPNSPPQRCANVSSAKSGLREARRLKAPPKKIVAPQGQCCLFCHCPFPCRKPRARSQGPGMIVGVGSRHAIEFTDGRSSSCCCEQVPAAF